MIDLRVRLKETADLAELHARHGQDVNRHSDDDAADKLCKRWQGPATVVRVMSPDSYLSDIGDGRVRYVHASVMCNFHVHLMLILVAHLCLRLLNVMYCRVWMLIVAGLSIWIPGSRVN